MKNSELWSDIPKDKQKLLDLIFSDLEVEHKNFYEELDGDYWLARIVQRKKTLEEFVEKYIMTLDITDPDKQYKEALLSILADCFDDFIYQELESSEFHRRVYDFFNAIEDVKIVRLKKGHPDFEMVWEMLINQ